MLGFEPIELGLKGHEQELLNRLKLDPVYQRLFPPAFADGRDIYTLQNVTRALAAFERSIVSMRSPYDRYRWGGDSSAITDSAERGELIFSSSGRGGCFQCHGGWNFTSVRYEGSRDRGGGEDLHGGFFNTGISQFPALSQGIYESTKRPEDLGKFRAPTLRNIAVTAPYMHDGSFETLEEVVDHYAAGGKYEHPNKSRILKTFRLSDEEKRDLVNFLRIADG